MCHDYQYYLVVYLLDGKYSRDLPFREIPDKMPPGIIAMIYGILYIIESSTKLFLSFNAPLLSHLSVRRTLNDSSHSLHKVLFALYLRRKCVNISRKPIGTDNTIR